MTTLNEDQKKELAREAMALWHFYNTFYRTKMDESEFIIRWLKGEIPKKEEENEVG